MSDTSTDYRAIRDDIHTVFQPAGPPWPHPTAWTQEKQRVHEDLLTVLHEHVPHDATHEEAVAAVKQNLGKKHYLNAHPKHDVVHRRVLDTAAWAMIGHSKRLGHLAPEDEAKLHESGEMGASFDTPLAPPQALVDAHAKIKAIAHTHRHLAEAAVSLQRHIDEMKGLTHRDALDAINTIRDHAHLIMPLPIPPIWHAVHERTRNAVINILHFHVGPHHSFDEAVQIVKAKLCAAVLDEIPGYGIKTDWTPEEDERLNAMCLAGESYDEIAKAMGIDHHNLRLRAEEKGFGPAASRAPGTVL